jgi:putative ABC transport system substrate-binding protein
VRRQTAVGRRLLLFATVVLGVLWAPFPSDGQPAAKVARIGYLTPTSQPAREEVFRQELRRFGYAEGQNIVLEYRSANGSYDRLPDLAAELVALKVDVLVTVVTQAALAAKNATATIPIVMVGVSDPVGVGLVASLARPGGNVTGTSTMAADVVGKQLESLREMLPKASRVATLRNPANFVFQKLQLGEAKAAAAKLKVQLQLFEARTPNQLDGAFTSMARQRPDALLILADPMFGSQWARIAELAARHRIPAVSGAREYADAGGLMTYGPDFLEAYQRAGRYVDQILKGGRPADLPVEQSTKFELVINARTAAALGITIPRSLVGRADRVVE